MYRKKSASGVKECRSVRRYPAQKSLSSTWNIYLILERDFKNEKQDLHESPQNREFNPRWSWDTSLGRLPNHPNSKYHPMRYAQGCYITWIFILKVKFFSSYYYFGVVYLQSSSSNYERWRRLNSQCKIWGYVMKVSSGVWIFPWYFLNIIIIYLTFLTDLFYLTINYMDIKLSI